jgi:hypothetical protein
LSGDGTRPSAHITLKKAAFFLGTAGQHTQAAQSTAQAASRGSKGSGTDAEKSSTNRQFSGKKFQF